MAGTVIPQAKESRADRGHARDACYARAPHWRDADAAAQANLEDAARRLAKAGARVSDFKLPAGSSALFDRHKVIMGYEHARALAWEYAHHAEQISATLRPHMEEGWRVTRAEYDEVREAARLCRRALADALRGIDFLLAPSATDEAPRSLASTGDSVFNRAWTLFGVPCINVPFGKGAHRLPLGIQLVGAFDHDAALCPGEWVAEAPVHAGPWWPAWQRWLAQHSGPRGKPPAMGAPAKGYKVLEDAPGRYVRHR